MKIKNKVQIVVIVETSILQFEFKGPIPSGFQNITGSLEEIDQNNFSLGAKRELFEESKINTEVIDLNLTFEFSDRWGNQCLEKVFLAYLTIKPDVVLSEEHKSFRFVPINELKENHFTYISNYQAARRAIDTLKSLNKLPATLVCILLFFAFTLSKEILATEPFWAKLHEGAPIYNLQNQPVRTLKKDLISKIAPDQENSLDYFLIYNKEGTPVLKIDPKNVTPIDQELALLPGPQVLETYPPRKFINAPDQKATFSGQLNIHVDQIQAGPLSSVSQNEIKSEWGQRYELRTFYHAKIEPFESSDLTKSFVIPFYIGLALNMQNHTWKNETQNDKLTVFGAGPVVGSSFFQENDQGYRASLGIEYALTYKLESARNQEDSSIEKFKGTIFDFGVEKYWRTSFGDLTFGSHYRRHILSLNTNENATRNLPPQKITLNTIGIMLGLTYHWEKL